tara:strand:+ start:2995 stop:3951 length:957 start_codon:yes stop_codon:yes gene_type:complete
LKNYKIDLFKNKQINYIMTDCKICKPFLKWVGGKTQIIEKLLKHFPKEIENYHEPFVGGGSVLLAILSLRKENKIIIKNKIYAYDLNPMLIRVYQNIQKHKKELYKYIEKYINEYDGLKGTTVNRNPTTLEEAKSSKESYYYWLRKKYNDMDKTTVECSALFMILNKTCFRGLYREGPNGFNVPYGHYKKTPTIISKKDLDEISNLIKDVEFLEMSFVKSILRATQGDFVYLDPPYVPVDVKSFVKYTADGFDLETHKKLFDEIVELNKKKIRFVLSNAKVDMVVNYFNEFNIEELVARRAIHSKNPNSTAVEVIITN